MKKLISFILLVTLCLSLTSCKKSADPIPTADSSQTESGMQPVYNNSSSQAVSSTSAESSETSASASASTDTSPTAQTSTAPQTPPPTAVSSQTVSSDTASSKSDIVRVSFYEGMPLTQVIERLANNGVCSKEALLETVNSYDYSYYPLIGAITPTSSQRCFTLEGYLFPSTYDFYIDQKPEDVFGVFLRNAESQLTPYVSRAQQMGYTMDEILTLASLIEKESTTTEMRKVSSVLHNRLDASMQLYCDATITYMENFVMPYLSGDKKRYNSYYNTEKCPALPAGPICNPGLDAIEAALNPESTPYYYFFSDNNGVIQYSQTLEEQETKLKAAGITG